ncbi:hypothetical protein STBA_40310 [Streptomyces sp. MP131-18]|nr:hypothetical protein STBA_40310 [Streptomyces sp. MP131-18]
MGCDGTGCADNGSSHSDDCSLQVVQAAEGHEEKFDDAVETWLSARRDPER